MLKQKNQPLQMSRQQLAINTVERMGDGVSDFVLGQVFLEIENIVAKASDLSVLGFRNAPDEEMDFARIIRKIGSNLLTNKSLRQVSDFQTPVDRIMV